MNDSTAGPRSRVLYQSILRAPVFLIGRDKLVVVRVSDLSDKSLISLFYIFDLVVWPVCLVPLLVGWRGYE